MPMIDVDDDAQIEREKAKQRRNKKHDWCPICGRPKQCDDPNCTHIHHCSCGQL